MTEDDDMMEKYGVECVEDEIIDLTDVEATKLAGLELGVKHSSSTPCSHPPDMVDTEAGFCNYCEKYLKLG